MENNHELYLKIGVYLEHITAKYYDIYASYVSGENDSKGINLYIEMTYLIGEIGGILKGY